MKQISNRLREVLSTPSIKQRFYSFFEGNPYFDLNSIDRFNPNKDIYLVPAGSGETIVCLNLAFPDTKFVPVRIKGNPNTQFHEGYPLNPRLLQIFGTYAEKILLTYSQP